MANHSNIEINPQFQQALDLVENSKKNLLLLGKAGTGKSTFLNYLRQNTKKQMVFLAPTGVAAINISGMTIHAFFSFSIDLTLDKVKKLTKNHRSRKILKNLNTIVIDEISMVRADLLDCVNKFLQLNGVHPHKPFGGMQMVFIGDLYQIPPIVKSDLQHFFKTHYPSPYFFSSKIFAEQNQYFDLIEFEKVYRQKDSCFLEILNAIRNNTVKDEHLAIINERLQPNFIPDKNKLWLYITGTNAAVKTINDSMLAQINAPEKKYAATIAGDVNKESFPTDAELALKIGAQIMMVNNDTLGRWVNGSLGQIMAIQTDKEHKLDIIIVKLASGETVNVVPDAWDVFKYAFDETTNALTTEKTGSFKQYPLRLAWALTVHKSQGKTFDNIIVDLGVTFTPGQMYVALSRSTSLNGIVLKKKVGKHNIFIDQRIVNFVTSFQYQKSESNFSLEDKITLIKEAIAHKKMLEITYLKAQDEKSKRVIQPTYVGEMLYQNKKFIGLSGICTLRQETRNFRVDRILELKII